MKVFLFLFIVTIVREVKTNPITNSKTVHTFSYLDDIADIDVIRGKTSTIKNKYLRRDEEVASSDDNDTSVTPSNVVNYMQKYGYLTSSSPNSEALHTEESVTDAIMQMQLFGGLQQTGILDEETLKLLASPRCGNKDTNKGETTENAHKRIKRFVIGAKGWKKRTLTYNLTNWTPKLGSREFVEKELARAFASWSPYAKIKFVPVDDYHSADIRILFGRYNHGDYYPFDGPGLVLAHAYYPYEFGDFGGDIHFDEDEDWAPNATDYYSGKMDFFTVAQHEIGHSLGLSHSPAYDSVMYPYYRGQHAGGAVGYDDVLAMYEVYIKGHPDTEFDDFDSNEEDKEEDESNQDEEENDTSDEDNTYDYAADEADDYYDFSKRGKGSSSTTKSPKTTTSTTTTTTLTPDYETSTHDETNEEDDIEFDICKGKIDSIAVIRNELFVFLGSKMWRYSHRGILRPHYPAAANQMFGFPTGLNRVDAVYERYSDGEILFFSGNKYWISNGNVFTGEHPRSITDFGIWRNVTKIDAVFVWGKNRKTYFFASDKYWRYDDYYKTPDEGYPRHISNWRGVPANIDGVITWTDDLTYFFKEKNYWRFNDYMVITESEVPRNSLHDWFDC